MYFSRVFIGVPWFGVVIFMVFLGFLGLDPGVVEALTSIQK